MLHTDRVDMDTHRKLLIGKLLELLPDSGDYLPFEGVGFYRRHHCHDHKPVTYSPAIVVIAQGRKFMRMGNEEFVNGGNSYFIAGVDMPTSCSMAACSSGNPFLSITIDLDRTLIARLLSEMQQPCMPDDGYQGGAKVVDMDPEFLDAIVRLVDSAVNPGTNLLGRMIVQEIHYRLLTGPFGHRLRTLNTFGLPSNQVSQAITWLKDNFHQPFQVDELARRANMATSTFHKHFKEVTTLSPLQYQKRLRLEEAQRLMLTENLDASQASLNVGYDSLSQFTREYKRLFGEPPRRDVAKIRKLAAHASDQNIWEQAAV